MWKKIDLVKFQLTSNDFRIHQNLEKVIVIKQNDMPDINKNFYESPIFELLIIPLLIIIVNQLITKFLLSKKEKNENNRLNAEIEKIHLEKEKIIQDISQIKNSFQPIVLSTLQKIQENILEDKIKTLRYIVKYKTDLFQIEQAYIQGLPVIVDEYEYFEIIYSKINKENIKSIENIIALNGYLFPNMIKNLLNNILSDLKQIIDIKNQNNSYNNYNESNVIVANDNIEKINKNFEDVIDLIRKDLHLDDNFIHEFINKYKV